MYHTKEEIQIAIDENLTGIYLPIFNGIKIKYKKLYKEQIKIKKIYRKFVKITYINYKELGFFKTELSNILLLNHPDFNKIISKKEIINPEITIPIKNKKKFKIRDKQKSKVYTFQKILTQVIPYTQKLKDKNAIKTYIDKVLKELNITETYKLEYYGFRTSNYRRKNNRIRIAFGVENELVILHELCHWFTPDHCASHGPEFMINLIVLFNYFAKIPMLHLVQTKNIMNRNNKPLNLKIAERDKISSYLKNILDKIQF